MSEQADELELKLPTSFYADRDLAFRIERMVDNWRTAIGTNLRLEAERDALQKRVQDSCGRGLRELVKLNNYALQHRNGIDVSWVVKVIEEVRACFEAALKGVNTDARYKCLPWDCKVFGCSPLEYDRNGAWCGRTRGCHRPISIGWWSELVLWWKGENHS